MGQLKKKTCLLPGPIKPEILILSNIMARTKLPHVQQSAYDLAHIPSPHPTELWMLSRLHFLGWDAAGSNNHVQMVNDCRATALKAALHCIHHTFTLTQLKWKSYNLVHRPGVARPGGPLSGSSGALRASHGSSLFPADSKGSARGGLI